MEIIVGGAVLDIDASDFVDINRNDFNAACADQPGKVTYIGEKLLVARRDLELAKIDLETRMAILDRDIRNSAEDTKTKITEDRVRNMIQADSSVENQKRRIVSLGTSVAALKMLNNSLEHRKDMLIQIGAHLRAEANAYSTKISKP